MTNLEIVQRMYAAFGNRDRDTILELFDARIEWVQNEGFPGGGRHVGAEAVLNDVFAKFRLEWDVWQAVVSEWIDAGNTIVAIGEYRGTYKATGKAMRTQLVHVWRVEGGKAVRFQQYADTLQVARVTGG